jgi:hypothetical protein
MRGSLYVICEPVRSTRIFCPIVFVTWFATLIRDCTVHIDHLPTEITLSAVTHLPGLEIKILHLDIELMERTGC